MDVIHEDIKACIQKELNAANEKYPLFSSLHEAYAVMLEEYEESAEELEEVKKYLDLAWNQIRLNLNRNASSHIGRLALAAERLAIEACQLSAMAEKAIQSERSRKNEY